MTAEEMIRRHNYRKTTMDGLVCYENVCAACGVKLPGSPLNAEQRCDGWPVCESCFLAE